MKFIIVFVALFGLVLAAPQSGSEDAVILRSDAEVGLEGYNYAFETSDGKSVSEEGHLENIGSENEALKAKGQFSYVGEDGVTYSVSYVADENGFQPSGAHIPVDPEA